MFNILNNILKGDNVMGRKTLSKTAKVRNLFETGADVSWKTLRNKFDLKSPAAMVGKLRNEGLMIYENRSKTGKIVPKWILDQHASQNRKNTQKYEN